MNQKLVLTATLILFFFGATAQIQCGFDLMLNKILTENKEAAAVLQRDADQWSYYISKSIKNNGTIITNRGVLYEIPVVVHVIHTGEPVGDKYNPTDEQIKGMIESLNNIFATTTQFPFSYPDSVNGGTSIPIRFKLAKRSPSGQSTNAILRVDGRSVNGYEIDGVRFQTSKGVDFLNIQNLSVWPVEAYYNIWLVKGIDGVNNIQGVSGFGYYPFSVISSPSGVVIESETLSAPGNAGGLAAHETGHYLGLRHTFDGSVNNACPIENDCSKDGDLICDTDPMQERPSSQCVSTALNPCTGRPFGTTPKNLMSYSNCADRFTPGQKERMLFSLLNYRTGLLNSAALSEPVSSSGNVYCTNTKYTDTLSTYLGEYSFSLNNLSIRNNEGVNNRKYANQSDYFAATSYTGDTVTFKLNSLSSALNSKTWIDYNDNGVFDENELVLSLSGRAAPEIITGNFRIPDSGIVTCKPVRVRCIFKFSFGGTDPQPCEDGKNIQVRDFSIIINRKPRVSIIISKGGIPSCSGQNIEFKASVTNAGITPFFQWKVNGINVGSNSDTYSNASLKSDDKITCSVTTNDQNECYVSNNATSVPLTMMVSSAPVNQAASIVTSYADSTCVGSTVRFQAISNATPGGNNLRGFQWYVNGKQVGQDLPEFTILNASKTDTVLCEINSNACVANPVIRTSPVVLKLFAKRNPVVEIKANASLEICAGTPLTFSASTKYGGNNQRLIWLVNEEVKKDVFGVFTYTDSNLNAFDRVRADLISDDACVTTSRVSSSPLIIKPQSDALAPQISISDSPSGNVCFQTPITISASITNGGTSPIVEWYKNNLLIQGQSGAQLVDSNFVANDKIYAILKSSLACKTTLSNKSNEISLKILNTLPEITGTNIICEGSTTQFNHLITNGTWSSEDTSVATVSASGLVKGGKKTGKTNIVYTVTNGSCVAKLKRIINVYQFPSTFNITTPNGTVICDSVIGIVLTSSLDSNLQWSEVRGNLERDLPGENGKNLLVRNPGIYTARTFNGPACSAGSAKITITKGAVPNKPIISSSGPLTFCEGGSVILSTSDTFSVQWIKNNANITNANLKSFTVKETGTYKIKATSSSGCTAVSDSVIVTVNLRPAKPAITLSGVELVSSSNQGNQWYSDTTAIAGATGNTFKPSANGYYRVKVSEKGCSSESSEPFYYLVTAISPVKGLTVTDEFSVYPNPASTVLLIKPKNSVNKVSYEIISAQGQRVKHGTIRGEFRLSLQSLVSGMYTIVLTDQVTKSKSSKSFIKM